MRKKEQQSTKESRPKKKSLPWLTACAIGVVLVAGVILLIDINSKNALEKARARVRAAGLPLTASELEAMLPHPEDKDNAAVVLAKAVGMATPEPPGTFINVTKALTAAEIKIIESREPLIEDYAAIAEEAVTKKAANFHHNLALGARMTGWEFRTFNRTNSALRLRALLQFHRGHRMEALQTLTLIVRLNQFQIDSPASLIDVSELRSVLAILRQILIPGNLTPEEREEISKLRNSIRESRAFSYYYSFELLCGVITYQQMRKDASTFSYPSGNWQSSVFLRLINTPYGNIGEAELLNYYAKCVEAEFAFGKSPAVLRAKYSSLEKSSFKAELLDFKNHWNGILVAPVPEIYVQMIRRQIMIDILDMSLGGPAKINPLTGTPYKTVNRPEGKIVYDFGSDWKDHGGDPIMDIGLPILSSITKKSN